MTNRAACHQWRSRCFGLTFGEQYYEKVNAVEVDALIISIMLLS